MDEKKTEKKGLTARVNGWFTIEKSAALPLKVREAIVGAAEGRVKGFEKVLVDPETGEEVKIKGSGLKISKSSGNVTCRISFAVKNPRVFERDVKAAGEDKAPNEEALAGMAALLKV